jgi:dGTPase
VLSRIEPKVVGPDGRIYGLNLTRASLDASVKYPWPRATGVGDPSGRTKFGFYADDRDVFLWLRDGAPERKLCIEAQVMDLSDDIAYSVHDFEDAIVSGYLDVPLLTSRVNHDSLVDSMVEWIGGEFSHAELIDAFDRLDGLDYWLGEWHGSRVDLARLKNLTSQLIGRFAHSAVHATRAAHPQVSLIRFGADVVVPRRTQAEIAVLKGIVAANVMSTNARQPVYAHQREVLVELAEALLAHEGAELDTAFADDWKTATSDAGRTRAVVDQVASLTDQSALAWHDRLVTR